MFTPIIILFILLLTLESIVLLYVLFDSDYSVHKRIIITLIVVAASIYIQNSLLELLN